MDGKLRRTDNFALNISFLNEPVYSRECICLYINVLQMMQNKSVIRILAQYKWKAAMKIYRKESQHHFSDFALFF